MTTQIILMIVNCVLGIITGFTLRDILLIRKKIKILKEMKEELKKEDVSIEREIGKMWVLDKLDNK